MSSILVNYTRISPHRTSVRKQKISKITIHHMAGNLTIEQCGQVFQTRRASANYGIGSDGRVGLYVPESDRSWASSSSWNDDRAVTIEVANCGGAPDWPVSDAAYAKLIELCVDICRRNGITELTWTGDANGSLTVHNMFVATACPGPYLMDKMPTIAAEVTARLKGWNKTKEAPVMTEVEVKKIIREATQKPIYNTREMVPGWGLPTVDKLLSRNALLGTEEGLGLSEDMLRVLVILDRCGCFDDAVSAV